MQINTFTRYSVVALLVFVVLAAIPRITDDISILDTGIMICANGLFALSLNLLVGRTGLLSFGHGGFYAAGAYSFGLLMQTGMFSIPAAFALTIVFVAALSALVALVCVRLNETYFTFITLAFQMLFYNIILSWTSLTGGDQGLLGGIPKPVFLGIDLVNPVHLYLFCCGIFLVCVVLLYQITQSPFGYTLRMIRDNTERARFLGVAVNRYKVASFTLAGAFAGIGGMFMALFVSGAYPSFGYWTMSGDGIFMIMLGGMNTFLGPLVGAIILIVLNDLTTIYTDHYGLVLGCVILVFVLGLRRGLLDFIVEGIRDRRASKMDQTIQPTVPKEEIPR
ncbi:MAG: branched-chain amino acid ABC transporter permease [Gammaproteobacteria bacterium]|nr:MAG: branched-chain amino acid ABC transporter permease [Gammaproteobacteria bacterium]RLA61703.1 MAG: branched-chain amino acid ABC transporter permease [Gammaproteobacteria bacterium]